MCWFHFSLPIGWNELGVIATVAAVFVALFANRKASKQLKSALDIQEQSKNISLVDKRIALTEEIEMDSEISELAIQILFDEEIVQSYQRLKTYNSSQKDATKKLMRLENANRFKENADSTQKKIIEKDSTYQELEEVDLNELRKQIGTLTEDICAEKTNLLRLMKTFISESIKPIE